MKVEITTASGAIVRAELESAPRYGAGGRQAVELYQGRVLVGRGYVVRCADGSVRIEDSDARLGADGSESEAAYRALDEALSAELGSEVEAEASALEAWDAAWYQVGWTAAHEAGLEAVRESTSEDVDFADNLADAREVGWAGDEVAALDAMRTGWDAARREMLRDAAEKGVL